MRQGMRMNLGMRYVMLAGAAIAISTSAVADEQEAIDGCIDQLRAEHPDAARGGQVLGSEFSEAATQVTLQDSTGAVWKCMAWNDGTVVSLAPAGASGSAEGPRPPLDTAEVNFPAGSTGTTIKGTISGHDFYDYRLGARAGQTMEASIDVVSTNGHGIVYFNVLPPGSQNEAIFVGSRAPDNTATVVLPQDGDYTIRVYLMGNDRDAGKTVDYLIDISVR